MNCQDFEMLLMEYVSEELDVVTCTKIEQHLKQCQYCCQELEREKVLAETLGSLPVKNTDAPSQFIYPVPKSQWWIPTSGGLVAAAVLLAILITGQSSTQHHNPAPSPKELAVATEEVRWTLNLTNKIIQKNEKETLLDLFGTKLPTAISGSLFPNRETENQDRS